MGTFQFYIPGQIGSLLIYVDMCLYIYIYIHKYLYLFPQKCLISQRRAGQVFSNMRY